MNTVETIKVTGFEAISYLVSNKLGDKPRIIEHDQGIDVDNAGRSYDHESTVDYEDVLWTMGLYVTSEFKDCYTMDDLFQAEVVVGKRNGGTDSRVLWFSVNTQIFDGESRGTHYEFNYPTVSYKPARDVKAGDEVDLSESADTQYYWRTVTHIWLLEDHMRELELESGQSLTVPSLTHLRIRSWA